MNDLIRRAYHELTFGKLKRFISKPQLSVITDSLQGEEGDFFANKVLEIAGLIEAMPQNYETDGQGTAAVVHLHYFLGGIEAWITEKDMGDGSADDRQYWAFGLITLTGDKGDAELGCISIEELIQNNVELDLYWTPKTLDELKQTGNGK